MFRYSVFSAHKDIILNVGAHYAQYAKNLDKLASFSNKVLWTDETKIELFGHNKGHYAWWRKNTAFQEKHLLPAVKFGGGSIMLSGCVASAGTWNMVNKVEGRMDSTQYEQIPEDDVQESVTKLKLRRGWLFQQDNKPKHCTKYTQAFMQRNKYSVLEWLSQSPDLNIIENLWDDLKQAVHARQPSNLTEPKMFCMGVWSKKPSSRIQTVVRGYSKHVEAVIFAKGCSTKY